MHMPSGSRLTLSLSTLSIPREFSNLPGDLRVTQAQKLWPAYLNTQCIPNRFNETLNRIDKQNAHHGARE